MTRYTVQNKAWSDVATMLALASKSGLVVALAVVSLCACELTSHSDLRTAMRYESIERTSIAFISDEEGMFRPIKSNNVTGQSDEFSETISAPLLDCSDPNYKCMAMYGLVFAIPRAGLSSGISYSVAGARLRVEQCLRDTNGTCGVALISADCQKISEPHCEVVEGGRAKSLAPGPVTYFVYNEDYGVTAFGSAGEWPSSEDEVEEVASLVVTQYILQGSRGLLKD